MWQWIDPGANRQPCGKFPAGQTTGSCEYANAFLCSTILSGDKRNLPAERKPERVNEADVTSSYSHPALVRLTQLFKMLAVRTCWQVKNKPHHLAHTINVGLPNTVAALRQVPPQSVELRAHIGC